MSLTLEYDDRTAEWYDLWYGDRDLDGAVARIGAALNPRAAAGYRLLDFGCGTASHALRFAAAGMAVTGCDISGAMIAVARRKVAAAGAAVRLICGSTAEVVSAAGNRPFDGAVSLFNVLNCLPSAAAMAEHLSDIADLLRPGGRMVLEVWNGAAVLGDQPRRKVRRVPGPVDGQVLEQALTPVLDALEQRCTLHYRTCRYAPSGACLESHHESQAIHFLTPVHYRGVFDDCGYDTLAEFPAGKPELPLTAHHWFAGYLLRRR